MASGTSDVEDGKNLSAIDTNEVVVLSHASCSPVNTTQE